MTMTLISTTTVAAGGVSNITFSSIPQTYTDLYLVCSGRSSRNGEDQIAIAFNGSGSGYNQRALYNGGGSAATLTATSLWANAISDSSQTANTFGNSAFYIPNYTSLLPKPIFMDSVSESNSSATYEFVTAGTFDTSSAITSIVLTCLYGSNFVQNTTASLYGILNGSGGANVS